VILTVVAGQLCHCTHRKSSHQRNVLFFMAPALSVNDCSLHRHRYRQRSWVFILLGTANILWIRTEAVTGERYCLERYNEDYREYMNT